MSNNILTLDDSNFDSVVTDSARPVLVDFYATWCAPCRKMEPILDSFATTESTRVVVGKVDIDTSPDLANRYNIRSLPTLVLFRGGKPTTQLTGVATSQKLTQLLEG